MKGKNGMAFILVFAIIVLILIFACMLTLAIMNYKNASKPKVIQEIPKTIENTNILAELVQIGDFVNYDAGKWSQKDIEDLGDSYQEEPLEQGKFGKFNVGDDRNNSITPFSEFSNKYNGWRVLKIVDENTKETETKEDDTVYLIHAGTTEAYYHAEYQSNNTEKILTGSSNKSEVESRKWDMYVNKDYAVSATSFTKDMLDEWGKINIVDTDYNKKVEDDLIMTGSSYWLGQAFNQGFIWRVNQSGNIIYYMDDSLGIRPVIKLRKGLKTSGQIEKIVGTDGITTKKVWSLD